MIKNSRPNLWRNLPKEYGYSSKINFPLGLKPLELSPQQFFDKIFELEGSNQYLIELYKQQKDYRKRCLKIMSEIFNLSEQSFRNWGSEFEKMPKIYSKFLGVIYERLFALREIHYQNMYSEIQNTSTTFGASSECRTYNTGHERIQRERSRIMKN